MSEKLIKPYEISVWEDTLVQVPDTEPAQYRFEEKKLAVIGSDTMTGLNKIYNPVFNKKANGERTLEFSMKYKYFDPYSGNEGIINPFVALLTNERKVKLHYDNEWYEFIVKEHTESSEEYEWTYNCTDAFVLELSKNGYNLTFDNELNNNQGTAAELAEKVLEDTDWQLGQSDLFKQLVEEPIYLAELNTDSGIEIINATGDGAEIPTAPCDIYLFYTYVKNKNGKYVQFIIRDENRQYVIDDKNVITDTNYRITTDLIYKNDGFYLNESDVTPVISWAEIETKYQAYRLVYNQLTTYDPVMQRTVDRFKIEDDEREVYRYIDYVYTTSNVVLNYITNGENFNLLEDGSLQGWNPYVDFTGMDVKNAKIDKLELVTKPELGPGKVLADISTLAQIEGFLKVKFKAAYDNGKNAVYNSGFENHTSSIQAIAEGDEFVFRWRAGQRNPQEQDESKSDVDCLVKTSSLRAIVAKYTQDTPNRWSYYYRHIDTDDIILEFEGTPEILNNFVEGGTLEDYYAPTKDKEPKEGKTYYIYDLETEEYEEVDDPDPTLMNEYYELHKQYIIDDVVQSPSTKYIYLDEQYTLTSDVEIVENKTYYIRSGEEGFYTYEKVDNPIAAELNIYYEKPAYVWNGIKGDFEEFEYDYSNYLPYYYLTATATKALSNSVLTDPTQKYGIFIYSNNVETVQRRIEKTLETTLEKEESTIIEKYPEDALETIDPKYNSIIYVSYINGQDVSSSYQFSAGQDNTDQPWCEYDASDNSITFIDTEGIKSYIITYYQIKPFYIQDIQFTRLIEDANGEPIIMGNIPTATSTATEYYYIKPVDGAAAEDVVMYTSIEKLAESIDVDKNDIVALYNENSEKNLTISASQSNCFDILQTIAETFECWIDLVVEHEDNGAITCIDNIPQKYVYLREYAGDNQWAGFKYGINLQSIERQINSDEFVTKLIVDQSQSEYVDEGYVSIASAPSNTSGESYILNFDYYYNQGLLNREEVEADRLNFINSVSAVNMNLKETEELRRNLEASMTALGSKRNVYTELIDTAKEQNTQALAEFEELTNYTYDDFKEQQDNTLEYEDDYYILTNDNIVKKDKIYYELKREIVEKSVESNGKTVYLNKLNSVKIYDVINQSQATFILRARTNIGNISKSITVTVDNDRRQTLRIPCPLSSVEEGQEPVLVLEYGMTVSGIQKWLAEWENPTIFDVSKGYYDIAVNYKQAVEGEEYTIEPVEEPSENPYEAGYYELFMDVTQEDTVIDLIGQIYVTSATINNYSGILTNIEQEYWNIRHQLKGYEDYTVQVWTGIDIQDQRHVYVELSDFLPGFKFTIGGLEYKSDVSHKFFDITTTDTNITFTPPDKYSMESTTYEIIDEEVYVEEILCEYGGVGGVEAEIEEIRKDKKDLVKNFNNKYSRYIQEGTWNSTDYIDSELYYLDALQVSNTSAQPTVSYTINVVEISQLEGFEWYLFDAGDKSYVEDTEFFGWHIDNVGTEQNPELIYTPAREEVVVSEVEWHLEEPDKNVITVQNYKTRFEDFFQRVSATVQTVQYNEASYAKITNLLDPNGTLNQNVLLESMNRLAGQNHALTSDGSIIVDGENILIQNLTNPSNCVIINNEGIRVSSDGGLTWDTAIDGQGINIGAVYTGTLNTNEIIIGNKSYPSFRWDKAGISAYHVDTSDVPDIYILTQDTEVDFNKTYYILVRAGYRPVEFPTGNPKAQGYYELQTENFTDLKTFVRFDEYGLYGIKNADRFKAQSLEDVLNNAHFAVTWDGFFIRNSYEDGGRVSITSDEDFQVIDGEGNERIKIGSLGVTNNVRRYGINIKNKEGRNTFYTDDSTGDVTITGTINALGGNFSDLVTVGKNTAQTSDYIIINGETASISSSNYNGGPSTSATQGWIINKDGDAIFNNITARGSIKTAVFEYAEIQAVGGVFIFRPSSAIRSAAVNGNNLVVTVEKQHLFNANDWVKISNYTTNGVEPDAASAVNGAGLSHIYKVAAVNGRVVTLEGAAAMVEGIGAITTIDELIGGALVSMGNYNTQTGINSNNYGIGVNSSDNTVNLPARAISLFETMVRPESSQKIIYNYRGILGTLPQMSYTGQNPQVSQLYDNYLKNTQGIYTDNMYLGDANQYLAFYTDGNDDKHLRISTKELIYELGTGQGGSDITWEDYIDEKIGEVSSNQHFWFSATPTNSYVLTKDIEVDSEKTYYVRSGSAGNYTYTVVTPEEGDNPLEEGWYEAALIPAGAYITDIDIDLFKEDPANNANIVTRNDGVYLKKGLDTLAAFEHSGLRFYNPATLEKSIELNSDGLALYAPNKTNASATLTSNGLTITDGSIILSNDGQLDNIALSNVSFTREINDIERADLRLAIGNKFGVKNDGTLYANNIIATGGNIGGAEINNGVLQIGESQITDGAITSDKIEAEAITVDKLLAIGTYIQFLYVPTLLTAQPNDWTTNWTEYYEKDTTHGLQADEYRHVKGDSAPIWEQNKYYEEKNENPCLLMGNKEKVAVTIDISQDINNGQMTFWQNWQPVAYINNNRMTIPESVMLREMMVGQDKWSWREHDGNLQLKWIGD